MNLINDNIEDAVGNTQNLTGYDNEEIIKKDISFLYPEYLTKETNNEI